MDYQPLEKHSVRMLHLQGASQDAPICCSLVHTPLPLAALSEYETVSYCWGDHAARATIFVDGESLSVPQNTRDALRCFRPTSATIRRLWIDSVCIDQDNLDERRRQVELMHDIYARAARNLIWLGEDDGTVMTAISNVDILMSDIVAKTNNLATFPLGPGEHHHLHQSSGIDVDFDFEAIIRLLERPWFSRLWVVQEATLATQNVCHCGSFSFDLVPLLRVARWLWTKRSHIGLHVHSSFIRLRRTFASACTLFDIIDREVGWFNVALRKGWFSEKTDTAPLFSILDMTTIFDATEPSDHVFGILGLWLRFSQNDTGIPPMLQPDYSKSLSSVFRDATRQALIEAESLVLLQGLHHRERDESVFPSWVRRWDRAFDPERDPTPLHRGFIASGEWSCDTFNAHPDVPNSIVLEGLYVDCAEQATVDGLTSTFTEPSFSPGFVSDVQSMIDAQSNIEQSTETDLALRTVLCAAENAERDVASMEDLQGFDDLREVFWSKEQTPPGLSQLLGTSMNDVASPGARRAIRYGEAAWRMCFLRRFFITTGGRLGLGPQTMQKGDIAVVLYGCEWPVILRNVKNRKNYELVGTAYIHGVMGGEAVQSHLAAHGEDADEHFVIV